MGIREYLTKSAEAAEKARTEERQAAAIKTAERIKKLIRNGRLTAEQIADIMEVPVVTVESIKKDMEL